MSSLALGRGLDLEIWLAGLFSAAELAAADLLLQLSVAGGIHEDEAASTSTTPSSTPRCVSPCLESLTAEERIVKEPAVSMELDRRARRRYRLLSDLYSATRPVTPAPATAAAKRRKTCGDDDHDEGGGGESE